MPKALDESELLPQAADGSACPRVVWQIPTTRRARAQRASVLDSLNHRRGEPHSGRGIFAGSPRPHELMSPMHAFWYPEPTSLNPGEMGQTSVRKKIKTYKASQGSKAWCGLDLRSRRASVGGAPKEECKDLQSTSVRKPAAPIWRRAPITSIVMHRCHFGSSFSDSTARARGTRSD